jgi:hypothetical protein
MWQVYSRFNEGLAIQSTFSRLTSSFCGFKLIPKDLPAPKAIYAGLVYYIDYDHGVFLDRHRALNGFSLLIHKRRSFEYEKEVRVVCRIPQNCGTPVADMIPRYTGIYVDCDIDRLIETVYVSPSAPTYFLEAVAAICDRFDVKASVIQWDLMSKPHY